jgi:pimeloyl-ACP methyl ester carboxylesterase
LSVEPSQPLVCDRIRIRASGLPRGSEVSIESALTDGAGVTWRASARYRADSAGIVDTADAPSAAGTYVGVDPSGPFWSMRPDVDEEPDAFKARARHPMHGSGRPGFDDEPSTPVTLTCRRGDGMVLATTRFTLWFRKPGVEIMALREGRLRGLVWGPLGNDPGRGVIFVFTGSNGGVDKGYAPLLASLGYRVVSLAFFNYEDRPKFLVDIDLEYFAEAFAWARRTFGVERVLIKGGSRGGELVLLLGATYPEQLCGIVSDIPMHVMLGGVDDQGRECAAWTLGGERLPYVTQADGTAMPLPEDTEAVIAWRDLSDPMIKDPRLTAGREIAVEKIACPLLLVSGEDDQMWDSAWGADRVVDRLRAHGSQIPFQHLCLRDTGHWLGVPNRVTSLLGPILHPVIPRRFALGGTPVGTAREGRRHWDTLTGFLDRCFCAAGQDFAQRPAGDQPR